MTNESYPSPLRWKRTSRKPVFSAERTKRTAQTAAAGVSETPVLPPQDAELASEMIAGSPAAWASAATHESLAGELAAREESRPPIVTSRRLRQVVSG